MIQQILRSCLLLGFLTLPAMAWADLAVPPPPSYKFVVVKIPSEDFRGRQNISSLRLPKKFKSDQQSSLGSPDAEGLSGLAANPRTMIAGVALALAFVFLGFYARKHRVARWLLAGGLAIGLVWGSGVMFAWANRAPPPEPDSKTEVKFESFAVIQNASEDTVVLRLTPKDLKKIAKLAE